MTQSNFDPRRRAIVGAAAAAATSPFWFNIARAQNNAPIKIGFPTPLTGAFSAEAQDQSRAAELAIREFNESGGFNGRKAELLIRDDKLNAGEAARSISSSARCRLRPSCRSTRSAATARSSSIRSASPTPSTKQRTGASTPSTKRSIRT
jgi:hypothetical protein